MNQVVEPVFEDATVGSGAPLADHSHVTGIEAGMGGQLSLYCRATASEPYSCIFLGPSETVALERVLLEEIAGRSPRGAVYRAGDVLLDCQPGSLPTIWLTRQGVSLRFARSDDYERLLGVLERFLAPHGPDAAEHRGGVHEDPLISAARDDFLAHGVALQRIRQAHASTGSAVDLRYLEDAILRIWDPGYPAFSRQIDRSREAWSISFSSQFAKDIEAADKVLRSRILGAVADIAKDPMSPRGDTIKPLGGALAGQWRYRIADHRLVYFPQRDIRRVDLLTFSSRGSVYA